MDKRLKITGKLYAILILFMLCMVIYDSFIHILPFYYLLYAIGGYVIGTIVWLNQKVLLVNDNKSLSLSLNPIGKAITIILLIIRCFSGTIILEKYNVIWVSDALCLVFIGIYLAKVKSVFGQIDEHLYTFYYNKINHKQD